MPHFDLRHLAAFCLILTGLHCLASGYFRQIPAFLRGFSLRPYRRLLILGLVLIAAAVLADDFFASLLPFVRGSVWAKAVSDFGNWISRNAHFWISLTLAYGVAVVLKKHALRLTVLGAILASALTGLLCHMLKFGFLRARPYSDLGAFAFWNADGLLANQHMFQSFPSGDAAIMGGFVLYLWLSVRNIFLRAGLAAALASTVFARFYLGKHWISDSVFALVVAAVVSREVVRYGKFRARFPQGAGALIRP